MCQLYTRVAVVSAKQSFSKFKIVKSCLRSPMSEEHLRDLPLISLEWQIARSLETEKLVKVFATQNA